MSANPISKCSLKNLADIYGMADDQIKLLEEFRSRVKEQMRKQTQAEKVYGDRYTICFGESSTTVFQKDAFIQEHGRKEYDKFCVKKPYARVTVEAVVKTTKPKDEPVVSVKLPTFGLVSAGQTAG